MRGLLTLGVPFGPVSTDGVTPVDPHTLSNRIFEIDAFDNSGLYSAVLPSLVTANDGELVLAWQDIGEATTKSPNQGTSGLRGIARQNAYGWGVELDGVDNRYAIDDSGIPGTVFANCTVYTVVTLDSLASCTVLSSTGTDAFQNRYGNPKILKNSVEDIANGTNAPSTGTRFVDCVTYTGSLFSFFRNSATNGTTSITRTFGTATNQLGATESGFEFFDGLMHYVAVFSTAHDTDTVLGVMAYLESRWQIA